MRIFCLLVACFIFVNSFGQVQNFGVFLDDTQIGSYSEFDEYGTYITSFRKLKVEFARGLDTIRFAHESIWTQDTLGNLLAVRTEQVFKDTTKWFRQFPIDTTAIDSLRQIVLGPYGIRMKAKKKLDSLTKFMRFATYIPDLDTTATVSWTVVDYSVEKAQKLAHIAESIEDQAIGISKRDRAFDLVGISKTSLLGNLTIKKVQKTKNVIGLVGQYPMPQFISSNTFLPDPENVNAIKLKIIEGDSIREMTLTDNSFEPLPSDSYELEQYLEFNHWVQPLDSTLVSIAFPFAINRMAPEAKIERLITVMDSMNLKTSEKNIMLIRLARYLEYPASLTFGLIYQQRAWIPHTWTKIGIEGEWMAFDPIFGKKVNSALRIPIASSSLQNGLKSLYSGVPSQFDSTKIQIAEFLLNKRPIRPKGKSEKYVEWKQDRYINHALGISFDIPEGFEVDSINVIQHSGTLLRVKNRWNETIELEQVLDSNELYFQDYLKNWTGTEDEIKQESDKIFISQNLEKVILGIPQGNSFLALKITAEYAESISKDLLKKNLEISF